MGAGGISLDRGFRPVLLRTCVREAQGCGAGGGAEAASPVRLVGRADRTRAGRREVVRERVGAGPRHAADTDVARVAAGCPTDASPPCLAVGAAAPLQPLQVRVAAGVLQPPRRWSTVVLQAVLRCLLPRTWRPSSRSVEGSEEGACPAAAGAHPRVPARAHMRRLRRERLRRAGVRPRRSQDGRGRPAGLRRGAAQGDRCRDRSVRGRLRLLPQEENRKSSRLAARRSTGRDATLLDSVGSSKLRAPARDPLPYIVRRLRRARPAGARVRSCA